MDYEEKARELMDFHMKTKESEMSNRLHKMAHGEAIMLECIAHCENGKIIGQTTILNVEELDDFLNSCPGTLFGDGYLIGKETKQPDYLKNFIELEDMYRKVDNIHALVPQYLKESDAYKV